MTLNPIIRGSIFSLVTKNGTKISGWVSFNLMLSSIQPQYGIGVPFATFNSIS